MTASRKRPAEFYQKLISTISTYYLKNSFRVFKIRSEFFGDISANYKGTIDRHTRLIKAINISFIKWLILLLLPFLKKTWMTGQILGHVYMHTHALIPI